MGDKEKTPVRGVDGAGVGGLSPNTSSLGAVTPLRSPLTSATPQALMTGGSMPASPEAAQQQQQQRLWVEELEQRLLVLEEVAYADKENIEKIDRRLGMLEYKTNQRFEYMNHKEGFDDVKLERIVRASLKDVAHGYREEIQQLVARQEQLLKQADLSIGQQEESYNKLIELVYRADRPIEQHKRIMELEEQQIQQMGERALAQVRALSAAKAASRGDPQTGPFSIRQGRSSRSPNRLVDASAPGSPKAVRDSSRGASPKSGRTPMFPASRGALGIPRAESPGLPQHPISTSSQSAAGASLNGDLASTAASTARSIASTRPSRGDADPSSSIVQERHAQAQADFVNSRVFQTLLRSEMEGVKGLIDEGTRRQLQSERRIDAIELLLEGNKDSGLNCVPSSLRRNKHWC